MVPILLSNSQHACTDFSCMPLDCFAALNANALAGMHYCAATLLHTGPSVAGTLQERRLQAVLAIQPAATANNNNHTTAAGHSAAVCDASGEMAFETLLDQTDVALTSPYRSSPLQQQQYRSSSSSGGSSSTVAGCDCPRTTGTTTDGSSSATGSRSAVSRDWLAQVESSSHASAAMPLWASPLVSMGVLRPTAAERATATAAATATATAAAGSTAADSAQSCATVEPVVIRRGGPAPDAFSDALSDDITAAINSQLSFAEAVC
jgi:hypothetical protein